MQDFASLYELDEQIVPENTYRVKSMAGLHHRRCKDAGGTKCYANKCCKKLGRADQKGARGRRLQGQLEGISGLECDPDE